MLRQLLIALALLGCSPSEPPELPRSDGELKSAYAAYSAFCQLCPHDDSCCLKATDFSAEHWSAQAGPYLRALREHYECRQSDSLIESTVYPRHPPIDPRNVVPPPVPSRDSCVTQQCPGTAEAMARELDRALAVSVEHEPGASLICSLP
jgi:hypothetical protein